MIKINYLRANYFVTSIHFLDKVPNCNQISEGVCFRADCFGLKCNFNKIYTDSFIIINYTGKVLGFFDKSESREINLKENEYKRYFYD
jgi:hypothetical protein